MPIINRVPIGFADSSMERNTVNHGNAPPDPWARAPRHGAQQPTQAAQQKPVKAAAAVSKRFEVCFI